MKQLLALSALLLVLGICSFLYRNAVERPGLSVPPAECTAEARACPDGTSVGREGSSCAFAPCAFPNVEVASAGVSFAVPSGYGPDDTVYNGDAANRIGSYSKPSTLDWPPHAITVRRYPVGEGTTADEVILANTRYQPADEQAEDFSRFRSYPVNGRAFRETTVERFEGLIYTSYFLVREADVLRFDIVEKGVQGWTDPALMIRDLPEHQALAGMLRTLQAAP